MRLSFGMRRHVIHARSLEPDLAAIPQPFEELLSVAYRQIRTSPQ